MRSCAPRGAPCSRRPASRCSTCSSRSTTPCWKPRDEACRISRTAAGHFIPRAAAHRGGGEWHRSRPWLRATSLASWVPVLTVREAAAGVGLTQWAIYRVIQRGELIAYKPCGRLRIHEADLDAWLESTRVTVEARAITRPLAVLPPSVPARAARRRSADGSLRDRVRARRSPRSGT